MSSDIKRQAEYLEMSAEARAKCDKLFSVPDISIEGKDHPGAEPPSIGPVINFELPAQVLPTSSDKLNSGA